MGSLLLSEGVQVLEKARVEGKGLRLVLGQTVNFPRPVKVWNPKMRYMEERMKMDIMMDASLSEQTERHYEAASIGKDSKQRILVLLGALAGDPEYIKGYPTTAISEATGVARTTTSRLVWELRREGLIEGDYARGGKYVDRMETSVMFRGMPEKLYEYLEIDRLPRFYGPIREHYWTLTEQGVAEAERLMGIKVMPLYFYT